VSISSANEGVRWDKVIDQKGPSYGLRLANAITVVCFVYPPVSATYQKRQRKFVATLEGRKNNPA